MMGRVSGRLAVARAFGDFEYKVRKIFNQNDEIAQI